MTAPSQRVLIIGLDGLMMEFVRKFVAEGGMPNVKRLIRRGVITRALPSPPVDTPTNWTTIATGSDAETHGVTGFFVHRSGDPLDSYLLHDCWNSGHSQAEFVWDALERAGLEAIVINYPVAWPPTGKQTIVVGGPGVMGSPEAILCGPTQWSTRAPGPGGKDCPIAFQRAAGWSRLPPSRSPILHARIPTVPDSDIVIWDAHGQKVVVGKRAGTSMQALTHYDLLLLDSAGAGYDTLLVCRAQDPRNRLARLKAGKWSPWIHERYGQKGETAGAFRFKLVTLSGDGTDFMLYRTAIARDTGFAYPERLCHEITEQVGPFIKGFDVSYEPVEGGHDPTALEHIQMGSRYLADLTCYLGSNHPWNMLITQIQFPDHLNHVFVRDIETSDPDYNPARAEYAWSFVREAYRAADRYIGKIVKALADDNTVVAILSDHAAFPIFRQCNTLEPEFVKAGLLVNKRDKEGRYVPDFANTRALPVADSHYYVWVNLKGRDPQGIVEPGEEYEQVCDQIVELLRSIVDPGTGRHPIALALRRRDAHFVGQGGDRCADVFFLFERGYDTHWPGFQAPSKQECFCPPLRQGGHSPCLPTIRFNDSSLAAVTIIAGPGIRRGYDRADPIHLRDVLPTLCFVAGMPEPADATGRVVRDLLAQ